MKFRAAGLFLALLAWAEASHLKPRNYETSDYYAVELDPSVSPEDVAASLGVDYDGPFGELKHHHIFSKSRDGRDVFREGIADLRMRRRKRSVEAHPLDAVKFSQKQVSRKKLHKRGIPPPPSGLVQERQQDGTEPGLVAIQQDVASKLDIQDPIFDGQWHLFNTVQKGHDVNVTGVWLSGVTGRNAVVSIVDDGLDMFSEDLRENYFAEGSWDFNDHHPQPKPILDDDKHGTRCAGEIAAVRNNVCGVGVAYDSKVSGIRILSRQISDADEAQAINYAMEHNHIYSCSWGPPDDGKSMDAPGILIKRAMVNGIQNGRGKKGSIFVFAAGNGASHGDNCNFDGYTNSIYSITVGAIDRKGLHPYYSEQCSAQLVVTYSSGSGDAIHTTDVGFNQCYNGHGGTSAAAPLAAGVFALALSARPELSWRDMQYLVLQTAVPIDTENPEWQTTTIGKKYSHKYGYGKLDSYAIVEAAKNWTLVKPQAWYTTPWLHVNKLIPQGADGLVSSFTVSEDQIKGSNLERLEHVTVTMNVRHDRRGDLSVMLVSPNGVQSRLSERRKLDSSRSGYNKWTFMSVVHWGESGVGEWRIIVRDEAINEFSGYFVDWRLTLWGESINAGEATLLPWPTENDDDDSVDPPITTTVHASTTSLGHASTSTLPAIPTDHIDRPVNSKPSDTTPSPPASTATADAETSQAPNHSSWIPSFLPTFGVSKRTQVWIYGSLAVVVLFVSGVGAYMFLARRRRLRRDNFSEVEFTLVDNPEFELDETGDRTGDGVGGRRKKRAGELYDAFAGGESDEEPFSDADAEKAGDFEDEDSEDDNGDEKGADRQRLLRR